MFFRHKLKVEYTYKTKTQYGHTYQVIEGFLFIPDKQKHDQNDMKKKNFIFVNHSDVPKHIKSQFKELYPNNTDEIGFDIKKKKEKMESATTDEATVQSN